MNLLEDLNFNFAMTYIIHKMLLVLKNHLNFLKYSILECFFKQYNRMFFQKNQFFHNI